MSQVKSVALIGDIEVLSYNGLAVVTVDQKTVLAIPTQGHGLDDLVKALASLVE